LIRNSTEVRQANVLSTDLFSVIDEIANTVRGQNKRTDMETLAFKKDVLICGKGDGKFQKNLNHCSHLTKEQRLKMNKENTVTYEDFNIFRRKRQKKPNNPSKEVKIYVVTTELK
jgi:hypothetical protein